MTTPSDQPKRGYDVAREALESARAKNASSGRRGVPGRGSGAGSQGRRRRYGWTGPGADRFDPQPLGRLLGEMSSSRGWKPKVETGALFARWAEIVGDEVAARATPTALEGTVLSIQAESTAWATNLRLMSGQILAAIGRADGAPRVTRLQIEGPRGKSWRKGPLHVSGRGPRDTYG